MTVENMMLPSENNTLCRVLGGEVNTIKTLMKNKRSKQSQPEKEDLYQYTLGHYTNYHQPAQQSRLLFMNSYWDTCP